MSIKEHGNGGYTLTGESINAFRYIVLKSALKLEVKTGMKATAGANPYKIIKDEFGFKGSKAKVLEQYTQWGIDNNLWES